MKNIVIAAVIALVATGNAFAATQQEKMRSCSAEAKGKSLKGEERREFMSQCLSSTPEEKQERLALKEKTRACTAEARSKGLKGDERRSFIEQCTDV